MQEDMFGKYTLLYFITQGMRQNLVLLKRQNLTTRLNGMHPKESHIRNYSSDKLRFPNMFIYFEAQNKFTSFYGFSVFYALDKQNE
jgi:hypothetical protein